MRYKATQKQIKAARKLLLFSCLLLLVTQQNSFFSQHCILAWCDPFALDLSTDKAMVLKHHPDKRKAAGEQIVKGDNDYFTCITKGWCWSWRAVLHVYAVLQPGQQHHCFVSIVSLQQSRFCQTLWRGEPSTAWTLPLTTWCPPRQRAKRSSLRCLLLCLNVTPGEFSSKHLSTFKLAPAEACDDMIMGTEMIQGVT